MVFKITLANINIEEKKLNLTRTTLNKIFVLCKSKKKKMKQTIYLQYFIF